MNEFEKAVSEIDERTSNSNDENVIESRNDGDIFDYSPNSKGLMTVFVTRKKWVNRVKKYAEDYPDEVKIKHENADGSVVAHIPVSYFKITRPPERELTEEQKAAAAERLESYRKAKENN